jgi:tetratricopeptide (TPR) repeat protein
MIIVEGNPHSLGISAPKTQQQTPVIGQNTAKTESNEVVDKVTLNTSSTTQKPLTYSASILVALPKHVSIDFPSGEQVLDTKKVLELFSTLASNFDECPNNIATAIEYVNSLEGATEILTYGLTKYHNNSNVLQHICNSFFNKNGATDQTLQYLRDKKFDIKHIPTSQRLIAQLQLNSKKTVKFNTICPAEWRLGTPDLVQDKESQNFEILFNGLMTTIQIATHNKNHPVAETLVRELFKIADEGLNCLRESEESYTLNLRNLLDLVSCLKPEYKDQAIESLKPHWGCNTEVALDFLANEKATPEKKINWYKYAIYNVTPAKHEALGKLHYRVGLIYLSMNRNNEALQSFQKSQAFNHNEIDLGEIHYRTGVTYKNMNRNNEALQSFLEAEKFLPDNPHIIRNMLSVYSIIDKQKMREFTETIKNVELKKLMRLYHNSKAINHQTLSNIKKSKVPTEFHDYFATCDVICSFNEHKQRNQKINEKNFINQIKELESKDVPPETRLSLALSFGLENLAKEIIKENPQKGATLNKIFQQLSLILDSSNSDAIASINSSNLEEPKKVELFTIAGGACLADNNHEIAMNHAIEGLKLEPKNEELVEIGLSAALVLNNKEKAQEFMDLLTPEKKAEVAQSYSADLKATGFSEPKEMQEDDLLKNYDPKKIHQYYTIKKQQDLAKIKAPLLIMQNESTWKIDTQEIKVSEVVSVGKYRGLDCWAKIDRKIQGKVQDHITAFKAALKDGITHQKKADNGIKFLGNKAVELKINADKRLFTNKIHVNEEGKLLIIFDHEGNHKAVENFANPKNTQNKLTYVVS